MKIDIITEMKGHLIENIMMNREIDIIIITQDMMIEEEVQEDKNNTKMINMIDMIINKGHSEKINIDPIILEKENILKIRILLNTNMIIKKGILLKGIKLIIKMKNIKIIQILKKK